MLMFLLYVMPWHTVIRVIIFLMLVLVLFAALTPA